MKMCCLGDLHYSGSREWLVDFIENTVKEYCEVCVSVETRICREINGIKCCNCASPIPIIIEI